MAMFVKKWQNIRGTLSSDIQRYQRIEVQDSQESLLLSLSKMVLALTEIARIDKIIKTALIDFLIASPPRSLLNLRSHKETISQMSLGQTAQVQPRTLTPIDQVLIALQFYAAGSFQTVKKDFYDIARMPGVIGCVDGSHVRIVRPIHHERTYVNRKNYHSINVQGICDSNNRFLSGFYCLHFELRLTPSRVSCVIIACSVLHNIAIDRNQPLDDEDIEMEDDHDEIIPPAVPQNGGGNQNEAFIRRQGFA
ncbi:uncharacterized protein LOC116928675 [Daphnia magna]|uniref:uncharacterized protein LOC116928675 n=1 Tax=Daphnia magna TaxID=35525 RepID=UPI001E1BD334|nr:uncharacterized protein LOC116928675 [Daphnia magna]